MGNDNFIDDEDLSLTCARLTEKTALAVSQFIGSGDEEKANSAAVNAMANGLSNIKIRGQLAAGTQKNEGTKSYILENVGSGQGQELDVALDPLEGKTLTAKGLPNALSVIAFGSKNSFLRVPKLYMEKLAVGPDYPENIVSLDMSPTERIHELAREKNCKTNEINICVLERPRNLALIEEVRNTGAKINLISDGDIAGTINCLRNDETAIDSYMGSGGAQEGILSAVATKCLGGQMQGRMLLENPSDSQMLFEDYNLDPKKIISINEMVKGAVIFAASGVTDSALMKGVRLTSKYTQVETLLLRSKTMSFRKIIYRKKINLL
mgnify:CR=1 FL=1